MISGQSAVGQWTEESPKSKVQSPKSKVETTRRFKVQSNVSNFCRWADFGHWTLDFGQTAAHRFRVSQRYFPYHGYRKLPEPLGRFRGRSAWYSLPVRLREFPKRAF